MSWKEEQAHKYTSKPSPKQEHKPEQERNTPRDKGKGGKATFRWPLVNSIKTGIRYLFSMADEALLASVFTVPIWGVCYALGVTQVTLPINFGVLWSIAFVMFLLQNNLFKRGG